MRFTELCLFYPNYWFLTKHYLCQAIIYSYFRNFEIKTHNKLNQTEESSINFKETLELKNLSVSYGKDDDFILKNINLKIKKGDRIGIVGESGIGKSTFLDCLMGLIKPRNGSILVDGKNIFSNLREWHKKIGYVPQSIYLIDDTIKKIAFGEMNKISIWKRLTIL